MYFVSLVVLVFVFVRLCVLSFVRLCVLSLRVVFLCCLFVLSLCAVFVYCPRVPLCNLRFSIYVVMSFSCRYRVDVVPPSYRLFVGVIVSHVSRCLSVAEVADFVGLQVRVARRPFVLARTQPSYRLSRLRAFLSCRLGSL